jgi:pantothenate synthetase
MKMSGASRSQARDDSGHYDADQLIRTKQIVFNLDLKRGIVAMHVSALLKQDDGLRSWSSRNERIVMAVKRPDLVGWRAR